MNTVFELFSKELAFKNKLEDLQNFTHISLPLENMKEDGEIKKECLNAFKGTKKWSDMKFFCDHCNVEFQGLFQFIDHKKSAGIKSFKVKCFIENCDRETSALYSYINHCRTHDECLAFSCIFCSPTCIFYNIPCLLEHYKEAHTNLNFTFYVCLECGDYFQSILQLRKHKMSNHDETQYIDEDSDDDDSEPEKRKKRKTIDQEWTPLLQTKSTTNLTSKNIQKKNRRSTVSASNSKKFYQCETCDKLLSSPQSLDYHSKIHSGEKPYSCRFCDKKFRSKQHTCTHEYSVHKDRLSK